MLDKKIKIHNNGVQILDTAIMTKINRKPLSPSLVGAFLQSPGDWVMNAFIMDEVKIEETPHLRRGNWFHSIMEDFFAKEPEKRIFKELKESVHRVSEENYPDMLENQEHKDWLNHAIKGYCKTWLNGAKDEKIAKLYINGETKDGLELSISGKIGEAKRNCFGYIDKVLEGTQGLIVSDWKTGKKVSNFDPTRKISASNPFDYWRQQIFYTLLLEQKGCVVESANLIFPCPDVPQQVDIDIFNAEARQQVIKDVETVDRELTECVENEYFFPFKKGQYNGWASYLCGLGNAYPPRIHTDKLMMIMEVEQ